MINILDDDFFNNIDRKVKFLLKILNYKKFPAKIFRAYDVYRFVHSGIKIYFTDMKIDDNFGYIAFYCGKFRTSGLYISDFVPKDKDPRDLVS